MKSIRILVAGNDWGGLNILAPLLRAWGSDDRIVAEFIGFPSVRRDLAYLVPNLSLAPGAEQLSDWSGQREGDLDRYLDHLLREARYDLVFCGTSAHAILERRLLRAAEKAGVPSVAFCDMAWAIAERFKEGSNWMTPDRLWVVDNAMRDAASAVEWPRPLPIDVMGSPLFDDRIRRSGQRRHQKGQSLRFISEPASTKFPEAGIDEFLVAEMLLDCFRKLDRTMPLIIRPHPTDSAEAWRRWCYARRDRGVELDVLPLEQAIDDTCRAVGISSILLAEMRLAGIATASYRPECADADYFCLPFEELGIERICDPAKLALWLAARGGGDLPPVAARHIGAIERATEKILELVPSMVLVK